jgi:hypothetical protein
MSRFDQRFSRIAGKPPLQSLEAAQDSEKDLGVFGAIAVRVLSAVGIEVDPEPVNPERAAPKPDKRG